MRTLRIALAALVAGVLVVLVASACGDDAAFAPTEAGADAAGDGSGDAGADAPVVPKGDRVLGIDIAVDNLQFFPNVQLARDAGGARATNVTFGWDDVERPYDAGPDAETDASTVLSNPGLHIAMLVLSSENTKAIVSVDAVDMGGSRAPVDLAQKGLDDPELGARYEALESYVFEQVRDLDVSAFVVASAVDRAFGADAAKYAAFRTFFTRAAAVARQKRPGVKVGFAVTSSGATLRKDLLAPIWSDADVVVITIRGVDDAGRARGPDDVARELDAVVAIAPAGKPVLVREAAFPSAAEAGGDEASQAAFVHAVFAAWDRHAARVPVLTFFELDDAPPETAAALAARAGRANDPAFLAMFGSLGFRRRDGTRKPVFDAVVSAGRARGF